MKYIVIETSNTHDGIEREGDLVDQHRAHTLAELGHATLLPVDPHPADGPCAGFYMRRFGRDGIDLGTMNASQRHRVPMLMMLKTQHRMVHWAARMRVGRDRFHSTSVQGSLVLAGGTHANRPQVQGQTAPLLADAARLRNMVSGEFVVVGRAQIGTPADGAFYGLSLYGGAEGVSVLWAACSASES